MKGGGREGVIRGLVSGGGWARGMESLCGFGCLHLDKAWRGPRSLTGRQACLLANLGQLRWRVQQGARSSGNERGALLWQGQSGQPSVILWDPRCLILLLSPFPSTFYHQTLKQRRPSWASRPKRAKREEFMVVFQMRKSIQASTPHFLTQLFFFTTLAASSHIFTDYQHLSLVKVPSHYRDSPRRNPMLNNIPNTIALSYRQ